MDVGWRLRANLHHDGGPGLCSPGVACGDPVCSLAEDTAEEPQPAATAAGRERREVPCGHFGAPPGRSCGLLDLWSGATRFECWWPLAGGNPVSIGSSRGPVGPVEGSRTSTVRADQKARTCGDGRRKFLPVMHRAGSFAPRRVKGATSDRQRGFVRRAVATVSG
jgi:hypothetical protein